MNADKLTENQLMILDSFRPSPDGNVTDNAAGALLGNLEKAVQNLTMARYRPEGNPISDSTFNALCCTIEWLQEGIGLSGGTHA